LTGRRAGVAVFLIFAIGYLAAIQFEPYPASYIVKAIPAIALAVLALKAVGGLRGRLLFAALLFAAAGDIALAWEAGENLQIGLGLFLVTQVLYVVTFSRDLELRWPRVPVAALVIAWVAAAGYLLAPSLDDMAIPVYVYLAVITLMGVFAAFRARSPLVLYGAIIFIASDSLIAFNEFHTSICCVDYYVMGTYYLAQFLIVYGFLSDTHPRVLR